MSAELDLRSGDDGTVLSVRVVPRASRTEIDGARDGALRVRLKAPPVDGAANKALCEFLAKILGVPRRRVELLAGQRGRSKQVLVTGLSPAEIRRILSAALM